LPVEDITLNSTVLNWPEQITPVFDESDEVRDSVFELYLLAGTGNGRVFALVQYAMDLFS